MAATPVAAKELSPITDSELVDEGLQEQVTFNKRRCCLCIPCFGSDRPKTIGSSSSSNWWERITTTTSSSEKEESHWWSKGFKKVREWSELVAGPKWKTFIRRFNKNRSRQVNKFQYDPTSYSLNFDEGAAQYEENDDRWFRDFSSRYAAIPISAKSSMDLGKDGAA